MKVEVGVLGFPSFSNSLCGRKATLKLQSSGAVLKFTRGSLIVLMVSVDVKQH